jgi:hypothetical protein
MEQARHKAATTGRDYRTLVAPRNNFPQPSDTDEKDRSYLGYFAGHSQWSIDMQQQTSEQEQQAAKKAYQAPQLKTLGAVEEVTEVIALGSSLPKQTL